MGGGELFVYVRAHVCLMRALQWARTVIRVVTEKTQNTILVSEYVGAAACVPDRRGEDQRSHPYYTESSDTRTAFFVWGKKKHNNQSKTFKQ